MSRNNLTGSRTKVMEIPRFNGLNTAFAFQDIDITQSRKMLNGLPNREGSLSKRPGTVPISNTPIGAIKNLSFFRKNNLNYILATNGADLYKFDFASSNFVKQTMTNPLNTDAIDSAVFKDANGQDVLVIADGKELKYYDGTSVQNISPAANDESPLPPNDLAKIHTIGMRGCLVHNTRLVVWSNTDTIWHSKIGYYDYFPNVDFQRFVRAGDRIQTCVSYKGALLVFMRRFIGVLFGQDRDNWAQDFLDTTDGCLAPDTVQTVIYPGGKQEIFYLTDDGVSAVYNIDTLNLDGSSRYSTKSVTKGKVDWDALGITKPEWGTATAYFHKGKYWLIVKTNGVYKGLVFDTSSEQWYPIENVKANNMLHDTDFFYLAGDDGHLKIFDESTYSDWDNKDKTAGTPIDFYWYSKMLSPKATGHDHFWDVLMIDAQLFPIPSTLDVEVNTYRDQYSAPKGVKTAIFIWGKTEWGESEYANEKFTDYINDNKRFRTFVKGQYAQIKLANNRDEPVEVYGLRYEVRTMDTYY